MRAIFLIALLLPLTSSALDISIIRQIVRPKVVMVKFPSGGGTGFYVRARSGKVFILTNEHVCENPNTQTALIKDETAGTSIYKKVLKRGQTTDLCLIEAESNRDGLEVASQFDDDLTLYSYGHPLFLPMRENVGHFTFYTHSPVRYHPINKLTDLLSCQKPMLKIRPTGPHQYHCTILINSIDVDWDVAPGSSGSPVVNEYGLVVGVIYAHTGSFKGSMVTLKDIREFLKDY